MFVLFPNLLLDKPCTLHKISFVPALGDRAAAVLEYAGETEEKQKRRRLRVLQSHLMFAAVLAKKMNPAVLCGCTASQGVPDTERLCFLADFLPHELEHSALPISWFARFLECPAQDEKNRFFCLYNAMGSLTGDFSGLPRTAESESERALLEQLLRRVAALQGEENDDIKKQTGNSRPFSPAELLELKECCIRRILKFHPQLCPHPHGKNG